MLFRSHQLSISPILSAGSATITSAQIDLSTNAASFFVNMITQNNFVLNSTTSTVFTVSTAPATQLQLLIEGESALPGSTTGKSASPATPFTAGQFYGATVNAVDNHFNLVPSAVATINMTENDSHAVQTNIQQDLSSGSTIFALQFFTASNTGWTVHVSTTNGDRLTDATSALLPVNPSTATKIMVTDRKSVV